MRLELQIAIAFLLDLLLGDPRWLPHPVRLIARLARGLERVLHRERFNPRLAGALTTMLVVAITGGITWGIIETARLVHPVVADLSAILVLYTTFAARDLAHHADRVYAALAAGDLDQARKQVALLVGRDTTDLDESDISRATVESVAENTSDGVVAPLLFAVVAGPVGAVTYKAINTLDSLFGYRNPRYHNFGWAAARLDDLVNLVPARLSGLLIAGCAGFLGLAPRRAWTVLLRDRRAHPSPNGGHPEAAVAGALQVQLGGTNRYAGQQERRPPIGDPLKRLNPRHIRQSTQLMLAASLAALALGLIVRWLIISGPERFSALWGGV